MARLRKRPHSGDAQKITAPESIGTRCQAPSYGTAARKVDVRRNPRTARGPHLAGVTTGPLHIYSEVISVYEVLITMSKTDRELLRDALTALEVYSNRDPDTLGVVKEIRARLAEPEPAPTAWLASAKDGDDDCLYWDGEDAKIDGYAFVDPLFRHPPRPVRLSDCEVSELMNNSTGLATYRGYKLFADKIMDAMLEKTR